jgi:hypothetical protein
MGLRHDWFKVINTDNGQRQLNEKRAFASRNSEAFFIGIRHVLENPKIVLVDEANIQSPVGIVHAQFHNSPVCDKYELLPGIEMWKRGHCS